MQAPSATAHERPRAECKRDRLRLYAQMARYGHVLEFHDDENLSLSVHKSADGRPMVEPLSHVINDELIDELMDGDTDTRVEYWKHILLRRGGYHFRYARTRAARTAAKSRWRKLHNQLRRAVRLGGREKWLEQGAPVYAKVDLWLIENGLEEWLSAKGRYP